MENKYGNTKLMLELINKISRDNGNLTEESKLYEELVIFVETDLMEFLKTDTPENITSLFFNFKYEFKRFREFVNFPDFSEKNIVGLGGKFSSGKSSFLNVFMGERLLPVNTTPTTSIPTLIGKGKEKILVLNKFDNLIKIDKQALEILNKNDEKHSYSHFLKHIFIKTEKIPYNNIVFLDTPGYSNPDSGTYSENTDKKIAFAQLNNANYVLWFVSMDNGTLMEDDIEFLNRLNKKIPIVIIVTKADKNKREINKVIEHIKNEPRIKPLNILDVVPFSRNQRLFPISPVKNFLDKWDNEKINVLFAKNLKKFFVALSDYFTLMEDNVKKELSGLNIALGCSEDEIVSNELSILTKRSTKRIKALKLKQKKLEGLQFSFFSKIKKIADITGIKMPEPSELDLIENEVDFEDVLTNYLKNAGLKVHEEVSDIFSEIKPDALMFDTIIDNLIFSYDGNNSLEIFLLK